MNKIRLLVQAIVMIGILTSCDGCDDTLGPGEILYGHILEYGTNKQIPVYASTDVPSAQATTAYNRITDPRTSDQQGTGYAAALPGNKTNVHDKITKIVIVPGTTVSCTPTGVVSIGANCTDSWNNIILTVITPAVSQMRVPATAANFPAAAANLPAAAFA